MSTRCRALAALGAVAAMVMTSSEAASATPAGAPQQLVVSATQGNDANDCSAAAPCATIQRAVDAAGTTASVIVAAGGTYAGPVVIAAHQHIALTSATSDPVGLTSPTGDNPAPTITNNGTLSISAVTLTGSSGIEQDAGSLSLSGVNLYTTEGVRIEGGSVVVTNPLGDADSVDTPITLDAGSLLVSKARIFAPIVQTGGRMVLDRLVSYAVVDPVTIGGGSALIENSSITGARLDSASVAVSGTADVTIDRSGFWDERPPSVDGPDASLTMIASTVYQQTDPVVASDGGTLRMAATALDDGSPTPACSGPITDGGYNSSYDNSCAFDAVGSRNDAPLSQIALDIDPQIYAQAYTGTTSILAPANGLIQQDPSGPAQPNTLTDAIPIGAVAQFDPTVQLCDPGASVDEIGQPAPVSHLCDIGAIELGPSTIAVAVDPGPHVTGQPLTLTARVTDTVSDDTLNDGPVTFYDDGQPIAPCATVSLYRRTSVTCTVSPSAGAHTYSAAWVPRGDVHSALSAPLTVSVGPAAVAIALSVSDVSFGRSGGVTAHLRNVATGDPVVGTGQLFVRTASTPWHRLGQAVTSDQQGTITQTITPRSSADYQFRTASTSQYLAGDSEVVRSVVTPTFPSLHRSPAVRRNTVSYMYGTTAPDIAGRPVYLQSWNNGRWYSSPFRAVTRRQRLPDDTTAVSFDIAVRLADARSYLLRVYSPATSTYGSAVSRSFTVRVV